MSAHNTHHLQLLDSKTYVADLTQSIQKAKTRINLISLILTDTAPTHDLISALVGAAERGVAVTIAADVFAYGELGGYISPLQRYTAKSRRMTRMAARLRAAGAGFKWLGKRVKFNPFGGVTHLKWAVVDDITYCFGGVNLYEEGVNSIDYMFKSTRAELAEKISEQHETILTKPIYSGYTSEDEYGTIYVDSGKKYESIIYDRLTELSKEAAHVLVVTQYCPSGQLATNLKGKSDVYYNQPSKTPFPARLLISYGALRTTLHSKYMHSRYLHAKFMIFTMADGKKIAITGSHNFSYSGVMFGTREVALETTDLEVIGQLEDFHKTYIA